MGTPEASTVGLVAEVGRCQELAARVEREPPEVGQLMLELRYAAIVQVHDDDGVLQGEIQQVGWHGREDRRCAQQREGHDRNILGRLSYRRERGMRASNQDQKEGKSKEMVCREADA
jgi:hypothetical protein